ncbi:hypothetical protein ZTR_10500 [Talaromyces verruculosus]|nr:hypothetical protein ZTR_10500 [Talaromyces verruculosus]
MSVAPLSALPPLHVQSLASEANWHLARQIARVQSLQSSIYIHPRVISYVNQKEKAHFQRIYIDAMDRDVVSVFWRKRRGEPKNVRLAVFNTITDPMRDMWHAWGIAVIEDPSGRGQHMLIYDCDGFEHHVHFPHFLLDSQRRMIETIPKRISVQTIWISCDLSKAKRDRCYQNTMDWIEAMVTLGDGKFQGTLDTRVIRGRWKAYRPVSQGTQPRPLYEPIFNGDETNASTWNELQ